MSESLSIFSRKLFAPEAKLLESLEIASFVSTQVWNIKLLEQICVFVFNLLFQLLNVLSAALIFRTVINELELWRTGVLNRQTFNVEVGLLKLW